MSVFTDFTKTRGGIYAGLRSIYADYSDQTVTGTTGETTLKTYVVPAGHGLYAGCKIIIDSLAEAGANNANAKTFRVKIASTSYAACSVASTLSLRRSTEIFIVSLTSQVFFPAGSQTGYGVTGSAMATGSVDFTGSFTITTTGTLGDGSDTLHDRALAVSFWYAP